MTVEEAAQSYGVRIYTVSQDANLAWVVRQIYDSDGDKYLRILQVLNPRVNWIALPAGTQLSYIDKTVVSGILY